MSESINVENLARRHVGRILSVRHSHAPTEIAQGLLKGVSHRRWASDEDRLPDPVTTITLGMFRNEVDLHLDGSEVIDVYEESELKL